MKPVCALLAVLALSTQALGQAPHMGANNHTLTIRKNLVLSHLPFYAPADNVLFQELVPCLLVDTNAANGFAAPFGAPSLGANEIRSYSIASQGYPETNPCYKQWPDNAVALAVELAVNKAGAAVTVDGDVDFRSPASRTCITRPRHGRPSCPMART